MGAMMSECKRTASTAAASTSFGAAKQRIPDNFKTFQQLADALQTSGFEACDVVLAIDFTSSNTRQGKRTFGNKDLHWIAPVPLPTSVYQALNPNASASAPPPPAYTTLAGEPGAPNIEGGLPDTKTAAPATATATVAAPAPERKRELNPYEDVLNSMSRAVQTLTASNRIHVVGFGDTETNDTGIFCVAKRARGLLAGSVIQDLARDCTPCVGVEGVMDSYRRAVPHTTKNGPTSFVPLIEAVTARMDKHGRRYCFVFIIGDGEVSDPDANAHAIGRASHYPISISMIGVGDGPWDKMSEFDDKLEDVREFDNFQFVPFHQKMAECGHDPLRFATLSLMEMPDQLRKIKELGLLSSGVTKGTLS